MANNPLSENIALYRTRAGMTQEELGRIVSVSAQAVSRWERGGTPDPATLPAIADALGVSLDVLFGHVPCQSVETEDLLQQELLRTSPQQRLQRVYELTWHIFKVVSCACCQDGSSYFRAMSANENLDRRSEKNPNQVAVNNYFYMEEGLLQACVAKDFHYVLLMQEPEFGFSSILKQPEAYRKLFALLAREYWLDLLVLGYMVPTDQHFTAAYAAKVVGIPEQKAQDILDEMYQMHLLNCVEAKIPSGVLRIYKPLDETLIVPMLYFAGELMHSGEEFYYTIPSRNSPIFKAPLGTDALSPLWEPARRGEDTTVPHDAGFSAP